MSDMLDTTQNDIKDEIIALEKALLAAENARKEAEEKYAKLKQQRVVKKKDDPTEHAFKKVTESLSKAREESIKEEAYSFIKGLGQK